MEKIQYGIAGFFSGVFIGFLITLLERRFIDINEHAASLFIANALTVFACGIIGMLYGFKLLRKKLKK